MTTSATRACSLYCLLCLILTASVPAAQVKKEKDSDAVKWKEYALEPDKTYDLLSMVRLPDHALRGTWKRLDGSIVCEPADDAQLMLPVVVSGSYSVECEFTRRAGQETVSVIIPVGDSATSIVLSGWGGTASGIAMVNRRETRDSRVASGAAMRPGKLTNGRRYVLGIKVTMLRGQALIQATLNGKRFVAWKGPASQVSHWPKYSVPCQRGIALLSYKNATDFHKCELTIARGSQAFRLEGPNKTDWRTPLTTAEDEPPRQIVSQCASWNGRKYYMTDRPVDIATARQLATTLGGRLLTISSAEENAFIFKVSRGVKVWTSGWRRSGDRKWYDERNRPLKYSGKWGPGQPQSGYWETMLGLWTATDGENGWHDVPADWKLHACIEWGEEYP